MHSPDSDSTENVYLNLSVFFVCIQISDVHVPHD